MSTWLFTDVAEFSVKATPKSPLESVLSEKKLSLTPTNRYCAPGGTVTRSPDSAKSCGMSVGRVPKDVLPVLQGKAVVKSDAMAPGTRLMAAPGGSRVL